MFAVPKLAPKTLGQELSLILKVFFANNVSSMLKRNCSSSSSQISEVFGKRIVDFLARNVADLKMAWHLGAQGNEDGHFVDRNGIPKWKQRVSPPSFGDGWTYTRYSVSIFDRGDVHWILALVHGPYIIEYFGNRLSISFNTFKKTAFHPEVTGLDNKHGLDPIVLAGSW